MRKFLTALTCILAVTSSAASAAVFSVSKATDSNDGVCDLDCSLREAIVAANANAGADAIHFALSGVEPFVIGAVGLLPPIDDSVTIDGYSQASSAPNNAEFGSNAVIQIELRNISGVGIGMALCAPDITVRGLAITGFGFSALHTSGNGPLSCSALGSNLRVEGNFIGLQADGLTVRANVIGIVVSGATTQVGGPALAQRNLIAGNGAFGVLFEGSSLSGSSAFGNFIGTDRSGLLDRGNGEAGVRINAAADIAVGAAGAPNFIAFNGRGSHAAGFSQRADLGFNDYFANDTLGIDLSNGSQPDGVTPNDADDVDFGSNGLQNFPVLNSVQRSADGIHLEGTLDVPLDALATPYRIDIHASAQCDANGSGEGDSLLGSAVVNLTQVSGESFNFEIVTTQTLPVNSFITAVATGPSGSSEFSRCVQFDTSLFTDGFE
ncbi:MAG: CSLREA domain-containing protein [Pseudomonadota bacterium]|nr:CSLREA domain-containing protein [Pseudomonadota bacterium]